MFCTIPSAENDADAVLSSTLTPASEGGRPYSHSHRPEDLLPCHGAGILASHEQPALDTHPSIRTSEASP